MPGCWGLWKWLHDISACGNEAQHPREGQAQGTGSLCSPAPSSPCSQLYWGFALWAYWGGGILWGPKQGNVDFHRARQVLSPWSRACLQYTVKFSSSCSQRLQELIPNKLGMFQTILQCCGLSPVLAGTENNLKLGRDVLKLFPVPFKNKSVHIFQSLLKGQLKKNKKLWHFIVWHYKSHQIMDIGSLPWTSQYFTNSPTQTLPIHHNLGLCLCSIISL